MLFSLEEKDTGDQEECPLHTLQVQVVPGRARGGSFRAKTPTSQRIEIAY